MLDDKRLGKQRVEVLQILRALTREKYGWQNHPVVRMWRGYEDALVAYGVAICDEWTGRGYNDSVRVQLTEYTGGKDPPSQAELARSGRLPPWLGNRQLHRSHRSALLRKDVAWYSRFFAAPEDLPYVWPVQRPDVPVPVQNIKSEAGSGAQEEAV